MTTGGTGKTPMAIWLCQYLQRQGAVPLILSRGFGAGREADSRGTDGRDQTDGSAVLADAPGTGSARRVNDEFVELSQRLPGVTHWQAADRAELARRADAESIADVYVLDDGYQHRRLFRDLNIALVDATCPFGHGFLLPRGLLREPLSQLGRADAVMITRCDLVTADRVKEIESEIRQWVRNDTLVLRSRFVIGRLLQLRPGNHAHTGPDLGTLSGSGFAFAGIGNAAAFLDALANVLPESASLRGSAVYPDHHRYTDADLSQIATAVRENKCNYVLCTHKDLVKIARPQLAGVPLYAVVGDLQIDSHGELERMIDAILPQSKAKPVQRAG